MSGGGGVEYFEGTCGEGWCVTFYGVWLLETFFCTELQKTPKGHALDLR